MPVRIRKVLFDAFGTLFSPRSPVHVQYADVARSYGISIDPEKVKIGFKQAYKSWSSTHPMYGKFSDPPLDPTLWWAGLIRDTFLHAGVAEQELNQVTVGLTTTLIERFWCDQGYQVHDDVGPTFDRLVRAAKAQGREGRLSSLCSVVSGSDPGVLKVLRSLRLMAETSAVENGPKGRAGGIREDEVFTTWEIGKEKKDPRFWEEVLRRLREMEEGLTAEEVLVVGDELINDYLTPRKIGFQTLLLRRDLKDHARMTLDDEQGKEDEVETVSSLVEVVDWIERQEASP